jgi:hypothetical protein
MYAIEILPPSEDIYCIHHSYKPREERVVSENSQEGGFDLTPLRSRRHGQDPYAG